MQPNRPLQGQGYQQPIYQQPHQYQLPQQGPLQGQGVPFGYRPQQQPQYQQQQQQYVQQPQQFQQQYQQPQFQQQYQQQYGGQQQFVQEGPISPSKINPYGPPPESIIPLHAMPPQMRMAVLSTQQQKAVGEAVAWSPKLKLPVQTTAVQSTAVSFQSTAGSFQSTPWTASTQQPQQQAIQMPVPSKVPVATQMPLVSQVPVATQMPLASQTTPTALWTLKAPIDSVVVEDVPVVESVPLLQKRDDLCIGIDLGTTFSCVGVFRNGTVEIMTTETGQRTLPSVVAFSGSDILVGDAAVSQASSNSVNTIYEVKRLMGKKYKDVVAGDVKNCPYQIVEDPKTGNALVRVAVAAQEERNFTPEEISAMILGKLKKIAETHLNTAVSRAVITVPAYFNDSQRQATIDAAQIAGLEVLRIINEPTASALSFGLDKAEPPKGSSASGGTHILVFDLGGGTFDVSLLNLSHGIFQVKAVSGNCHLGGKDFDDAILKLVSEKTGFVNLSSKGRRRLLTACEKAKRVLSSAPSTVIEVDAIHEGKDLRCEVTRAQFEQANGALFDLCLESVRSVLRDAQLDRSKVDHVVLVGGSTRIPRIQEMVKAYFSKQPNMSLNPDEAVAVGASIQAAILGQHSGNPGDKVLLVDVTPLSLGVETAGGLMNVLVPRNFTIPCLKSNVFSTYRDNQESVLVSIFEGERAMCSDNNLLGDFNLSDLTLQKAGVPKISVTFEIDVNGCLHVSAVDEATQNQNFITIKSDTGRLSKERIAELVAEAAEHQEADRLKMEQIDAKNLLEKFLLELRQMLKSSEVAEKVPEGQRMQIDAMIGQNLTWIATDGNLATTEQLVGQKRQIEEALAPILGRLYQTSGQVPTESKMDGPIEGVDKGAASEGGAMLTLLTAPTDTPLTQTLVQPVVQTTKAHLVQVTPLLPSGVVPLVQVGAVAKLGPPYDLAAAPMPGKGLIGFLPPPISTSSDIRPAK